MAKNPNAKGLRKKVNAAKTAERAATKRTARNSCSSSKGKQTKTGCAPTLKQCHQKPSSELRMMVEKKHPGHQNAKTVLDIRQRMAEQQHQRQQPVATA